MIFDRCAEPDVGQDIAHAFDNKITDHVRFCWIGRGDAARNLFSQLQRQSDGTATNVALHRNPRQHIFPHPVSPLGQDLKNVLLAKGHHREHSIDPFIRNIFMEQIAVGADEYHARLFPF